MSRAPIVKWNELTTDLEIQYGFDGGHLGNLVVVISPEQNIAFKLRLI